LSTPFVKKLQEKQRQQREVANSKRKEIEDKAFHASTQNRVIDALDKNTRKSLTHEPTVKLKNTDLAKTTDIKALESQLQLINLTLSGDTKWQAVCEALNNSFSQLEKTLNDTSTEEVKEQSDKFVEAAKAFSSAIKTVQNITVETDGVLEASVNKLVDKLDKTDFTPKVDNKVEVEAPDLSGIESEIAKLETAIKAIKLEEKETDLTPLVEELIKLQGEIKKVYTRPIPVPEYPTQVTVVNPDGSDVGTNLSAMAIENAIESLAFDLDAAAFSGTSNQSTDYILDSIEFNFSSSQSRTITVTSPFGTVLYQDTNTNTSVSLTDMNIAYDGGDNFSIDVTTTSGACLMDVVAKVKRGETPLSGNSTVEGDVGSRWYFSNKENTGTYAYYGYEDKDGNWHIRRKTIATDVWLFAAGASGYSTAWTNRASQTYASAATTFN
jgi:hypothetical protein